MLVNFKVKNFKSYKDLKEFSMEATKLKNLKESNTFDMNNMSLLKSAVIYGANASGKSSLLDAIKGMKSIIKNSILVKKSQYNSKAFVFNVETENKETFFEIEFIIDDIIYRYGFTIAVDATILQEWLFQKKLQVKARESRLFKRIGQNIEFGTFFKEGKAFTDIEKEFLFLSMVANFDKNGVISKKILNWFSKLTIVSNIKSDEFLAHSFEKLENEPLKKKILNFIKGADIGIYDITKKQVSFEELKKDNPNIENLPSFIIEDMKKKGLLSVETKHMQYTHDNTYNGLKILDLSSESDGTQKLLALSAPIIEALSDGRVLIIDELDNSLHTELLKAIVMLFNSEETNPNNAQLIFTTHDTNLLNQKFFRRDQIWFTEKDIYGATDLYSLVEYGKGKTRDDLELAKNYLKGKFGAIPHIALNYEVD